MEDDLKVVLSRVTSEKEQETEALATLEAELRYGKILLTTLDEVAQDFLENSALCNHVTEQRDQTVFKIKSLQVEQNNKILKITALKCQIENLTNKIEMASRR